MDQFMEARGEHLLTNEASGHEYGHQHECLQGQAHPCRQLSACTAHRSDFTLTRARYFLLVVDIITEHIPVLTPAFVQLLHYPSPILDVKINELTHATSHRIALCLVRLNRASNTYRRMWRPAQFRSARASGTSRGSDLCEIQCIAATRRHGVAPGPCFMTLIHIRLLGPNVHALALLPAEVPCAAARSSRSTRYRGAPLRLMQELA